MLSVKPLQKLYSRVAPIVLVLFASCGGGGDVTTNTPPVAVPVISISISPTSPATAAGGSIPLTASVAGTTNSSVTWDLPGGAASGSIANTGANTATYTAPATAGTYIVRAVSVADVSKSASVSIVVTPGTGFRVTGPPRIAPSTSAQFAALFNDNPATAVWSIDGAANGCTVSSTGLFTAGATNTTVTLRATDAAQSSRAATQAVTVASQVTLAIVGPPTPMLTTADMVTFYTSVSPAGVNSSVSWTVSPATAGAVIPVDWFYGFVPNTAGTTTVTATSVADPAISATFTATVTVAGGPSFAATAAPSTSRYEHAAAALPDGRVVLIGGQKSRDVASPLTSTDVFSPTLGAFTAGPALVNPRFQAEALAIDATRVLVN